MKWGIVPKNKLRLEVALRISVTVGVGERVLSGSLMSIWDEVNGDEYFEVIWDAEEE